MIKKAIFFVVASFAMMSSGITFALTSGPAEPQSGMWWSPAESGRGYAIDAQGDKMVVTTFAYDDNGSMQWYFSPGDMQSGGAHWCGPLLKFNFGQPLNGIYVAPVQVGNDGTMCIDFNGRVNGTLTMPSGRRIAIQRQNFGVGDPPSALLGSWAFVYSIGSAPFADVYQLTQLAAPSSPNGTGLALDVGRMAGFEYQKGGTNAGFVQGVRINSSGTVLDAYLFQLQMEEGRGVWIAPITGDEYGMNAWKLQTAQGISKRAEASTVGADLEAKGAAGVIPVGLSIDELTARDPSLGNFARRTYEALKGANK